MIRKLLSTSSLSAFLVTAAFAQSAPANDQPVASPSADPAAVEVPAAPMVPQTPASFSYFTDVAAGRTMSDAILGSPLLLADQTAGGEVDDLIVGADGSVRALVVTTGPALGPRTRRVAIPLEMVSWRSETDPAAAVFTGEADDLVSAPGLQDEAAAPEPSAADTGTTVEPAVAPPISDVAEDPEAPVQPAEADVPRFATSLEPETFLATTLLGAPVYAGMQAGSDKIGTIEALVVDMAGAVDGIVVGVGGFLGVGEKRVGVPFEAVVLAPEQVDVVHASLAVTRSELDRAPAFLMPGAARRAPDAAGAEAPTGGRVGPSAPAKSAATAPAPASSELSAQALIGSTVLGPDGKRIGEVGDIVLDAAGAVEAVVVDVGGFLGIGEKPVAVAMDNLELTDSRTVSTRFTRDELEAAPTYDSAARSTDPSAAQSPDVPNTPAR